MTGHIDPTEHFLLICEFCGCKIEHPRQRCAALEDGRCQPWAETTARGPQTVPRQLPAPVGVRVQTYRL